jgi:RNA polymerase sigma-70 factor (ECF subfamily)
LKDSITENRFPSFDDLENDTWDFGTMHGFQFSYKIVEFIVQKYGLDHLNKLVRNPSDFEGIFHCPESELHRLWVQYLKQSI